MHTSGRLFDSLIQKYIWEGLLCPCLERCSTDDDLYSFEGPFWTDYDKRR
jgi:hypothetical protein